MNAKYEGVSFPMNWTAVKLVQQREHEVMKVAVLKVYSFISRFSYPILPKSIHCPQIQREIHLKIMQISLKIWWLITCHYCYSQIRRSLNTAQKFCIFLLVATSIGKAFLKYSVNGLLKIFEVTYLLACKDIGSANHSTKVYTIYIMLPQTSGAAVILDNS